MIRIYLSGKMGGRPGRDVLDERRDASVIAKSYDFELIDPAKGEKVDYSEKLIDLKMDFVTMKNFVAKDTNAVLSCDVLLVITGDTPSDGTWWEMGIAKANGIPIVMVAPKRYSGELMGFSNILVDVLSPDLETAFEFIAENYLRGE